MDSGMDYVRILRDLREDADKTQTQIAEVLGTSQTMYARYERGANELPIHHLITLSRYYGVSTDYLWVSAKNAETRTGNSLSAFFCSYHASGVTAWARFRSVLPSPASGNSPAPSAGSVTVTESPAAPLPPAVS